MKNYRQVLRWVIVAVMGLAVGVRAADDGHMQLKMRVEPVSSVAAAARSAFGAWVTREWMNARVGFASLRYTGPMPRDAMVRFFFVGRNERTKQLELYHYHSVEARLNPGATIEVSTISPVVVLRKTTTTNADYGRGFDQVSGIVPFGWVVRVESNGATIGTASSTPELQGRLAQLIAFTGVDKLAKLDGDAKKRVAAR